MNLSSRKRLWALLAVALVSAPVHAQTRGLSVRIAEMISNLFVPYDGYVAKTYKGKIYLTESRVAPMAVGALIEIVNSQKSRIGVVRIDRAAERYAVATPLKGAGAIVAGRHSARGFAQPVRILWIGDEPADETASALLSEIEEAVREIGSVDLVTPEVAHHLFKSVPHARARALAKTELSKTAAVTNADFIVLVSVNAGEGPAGITLALLDNLAGELLEETFLERE